MNPPGKTATARVLLWMMAQATGLGCAHDESAKPSGPVVDSLSFEGNGAVSSKTIQKGIATEETGWWPFARKHHFDPYVWQMDLRRIERMYMARGYFQGRVVADEVKEDDGEVDLKAVVEEGKQTIIESVEVRGLEALADEERESIRAELRDELGLREGMPFAEAPWQEAKAWLSDELRRLGRADAKVDGMALVDTGTLKAKLVIDVDAGPEYRFGWVEMHQGQSARIPSDWIWEQVRLAIPEGERYSPQLLMEAQRRVVGMGAFSVVKVSDGTPDPAARIVPIVVEVREAPLRMIRTGAGIRVDQVRNEGRVSGEWSHLDFLGGMRRLRLRSELGWAFIPNAYTVVREDAAAGRRNGPIARVGLQFEQPRFLERPSLRERTSLDLERTLEQAYDALGGRLGTGVTWLPWSTLSVHGSYNIQGYYLNGPAIAGVSAAPLTLGCGSRTSDCFIWLSYVEQIFTWDRRDDPLDARNGTYLSLSLQEGGGPLGGSFTYLRVLPEIRGYLSFGEDDVLTLSGRLRVGALFHGSGPSAVVTRFYAGGGVSMRGFNDRRLSPLLLAPPPSGIGSTPVLLTLPIGGNGLIEGSFELRYQLTENVVVAAFVDFAQVTEEWPRPADVRSLLWAVGAGVRYQTPIGPIRVDIGRRLQIGRLPPLLSIDASGAITAVPYEANDSCFGIGGSGRNTPVADNLCVLHIAIGEAF